ncbi:MAG: PAS domain-containing protein [bacterium]
MHNGDLYQQYFKSMPCFITVQDRDFRLIDANDRFRKSFGDWGGRCCYQVYKQRSEICENCPVEKTFRDGQSHTSEELVTTLNGREVWVIVYTTPIRNEAGEIVSVMEMSTDITDIKLLHKQLRASQQRHKMLFEEVPCYISIQDKSLRIVEASRMHRETFGVGYGKKCYEVYKHRSKECMPCSVRQTFKDGESRIHEEVVTSENGRPINVLVHTAPLRNDDGEIENVIEMSTDITQIRQLQDKLTSVGLLIGTISHGIKGLLNGLDGGIYLVNTGLKKTDQARIDKGWEIVLRNVDRIGNMVRDILYYAKDREPQYMPIGAGDFARDVCSLFGDKAAKLGVAFKCNLADGVGEFEGDQNALRSLLVNLLENSLDACRVDTKKTDHAVNISLEGTPESVIFEVSDTGIGMDQETREKAFSLFFSSKGAGGTGLGLFISNKIARAHGGRIQIVSEEGVGSRFVVTLPRKRPPELVVNEDETK